MRAPKRPSSHSGMRPVCFTSAMAACTDGYTVPSPLTEANTGPSARSSGLPARSTRTSRPTRDGASWAQVMAMAAPLDWPMIANDGAPTASAMPTVATMPAPRLEAASRGTGWFRRLASSTTMEAAQIRPSHGGRQQQGRYAGLAVQAHQVISVLIRDDRGDDSHATTASAVVILMSRSVTGSAPRADDERVVIAVPGGEPFREHQGCDRLVPGERAARVA